MIIFIIGDYRSGTGPANVTKELIKSIPPKNRIILDAVKKPARALEILSRMHRCDAALFSGYSKQNIFGMGVAHFFRKPCAYLMHGCVEYENEINLVPDAKMASCERKMLKRADLILAVSAQFESWLKERYPEHRDKISHLTNGINWDIMKENFSGDRRNDNGIISVGGGMPRKRIANLCLAVERLRKSGHENLTLTVAGDRGADSARIDAFDFVKDVGIVSQSELMKLYHRNRLFIQNSCFETFGLAPLEALLCETDILVSDKCGALSVIKNYQAGDIITDTEDIDEIASKIEAVLKNENHTRLLVELDKESTSWEKRSSQLMEIMEGLVRSEKN